MDTDSLKVEPTLGVHAHVEDSGESIVIEQYAEDGAINTVLLSNSEAFRLYKWIPSVMSFSEE